VLEDRSSHHQVSMAIEANMVQFRSNIGRLPHSKLRHYGSGVSIINQDIPHYIYNTVLGVSLDQADPRSAIGEILEPYRQLKLPVLWWAGPASQRAELGMYLEEAGLVKSLELPGMAAQIDPVLAQTASAHPELVIEQVTDSKGLQAYMQVFRGFGLPELVNQPFSRLFQEYALTQTEPWYRFVGSYAGQAVAIAELYLGAGVAGIYSLGTALYYRRRGFGRALTLTALAEARRRGFQVAILHSSLAGYSLYRSLGFTEFCRLQQYIIDK